MNETSRKSSGTTGTGKVIITTFPKKIAIMQLNR